MCVCMCVYVWCPLCMYRVSRGETWRLTQMPANCDFNASCGISSRICLKVASPKQIRENFFGGSRGTAYLAHFCESQRLILGALHPTYAVCRYHARPHQRAHCTRTVMEHISNIQQRLWPMAQRNPSAGSHIR